MTDNQIIKVLEICVRIHNDCRDCPLLGNTLPTDECVFENMSNALDLINRQKAEIERLSLIVKDLGKAGVSVDKLIMIKDAKAEAIKEFAERLKGKIQRIDYFGKGDFRYSFVVEKADIDNLVKEMVGEE